MQKHHNFTSLPIVLHHDIFSRLSSRPLHTCKCVSKEWNSIITSPEFTDYFHTLHPPHSNRLLVFNSLYYLSSLDFGNTDNILKPKISKHDTIILPEGVARSLILVGTCNGLVCVFEENCLFKLERHLYVYNPFTRRLWNVPILQDLAYWLYGFWYDSATDDYKIMRIPWPRNPNIEAHVFSLRSWTWKQVGDFPFELLRLPEYSSRTYELRESCSSPCKFVDGNLHWVVVLNGNEASIGIGRFNVSSEDYSLMELPPVLSKGQGDGPGYVELDVFEGSLSLQVMRYNYIGSHQFDVWVMKEYGVSESWSRLFQIDYLRFSREVWIKALAYSNTGDRILVARESTGIGIGYYWYNSEGKELESAGYVDSDSEHGGFVRYLDCIVCVVTLISPICGAKQLHEP